MNVALVAGCCVAGAAVGVVLPVEVVPSEDGRTAASGPRPAPAWTLGTVGGGATVLATAALWGALAARVGARWVLPADLVVAAAAVALTVIDLRHRLLPRRLIGAAFVATLAVLVLAAAATGDGDALLRAVACALGAWVVFFVLRFVNPRGLGGGDVNLAALLALVLGWDAVEAAVVGLATGAVLAALFAVIALAARRVRVDTTLSYGPFLVVGALLILLAAPDGRLFG